MTERDDMPLEDIRLRFSFRGHPKREKLRRRLGPAAVESLVDLWLYAAQQRQDGHLSDMDDEDVAIAANWTGDPTEFINALVDCRWLDRNADGQLSLHDWGEAQPYVVQYKKYCTEQKQRATARWDKEKCGRDKEGSAPTYLPTNTNAQQAAQNVQKEVGNGKENQPKKRHTTPRDYSPDFEVLWKLYPRRLGKRRAWISYYKLINESVPHSSLLQAVKNYATAMQGTEDRYIKHASTFLSHTQRPWEDWVTGNPTAESEYRGYDF